MIKRMFFALFAFVMMCVAMEVDLGGSAQVSGEAGSLVEEDGGRRLMVLILDSLSVEDAQQMPALEEIRSNGFSTEI